MTEATRQVYTSCAHDCGGKCLLVAHVRGDRVVGVSGDPAAVRQFHLEPCVRGLRYETRVHHPGRLLQPLIRRGLRGQRDFRTASWDEALALIAGRLGEIRAESGPGALLCLGRSGSLGALLHDTKMVAQRFFSLCGGFLGTTGNYSNGACSLASQYTYGTTRTANSRTDWFRSRLLLLWGWDPLVTVMGSHTAWALRECKRRGIPIVVVDPRRSPTAALADRWVPIRPGSDVALLSALAFELMRNGWHDADFVRRHAVGYEAYAAYLLGEQDGVPKTPEWQEPITGVPADVARWLAREYGTRRPAALMPGWGPQRSPQGEQFHRATMALATLAGYVGIPGGGAAGSNGGAGVTRYAQLPVPPNPYDPSIPIYRWVDCVLKGPAGGYPAQPRAVYIVGGNVLGQHPDTQKTAAALSRADLVVVHEQFMTPTAAYADVVLPATTFMERNDILYPYDGFGRFYLYQRQAIAPLGQARNDLDVFAELAERLGCGAAYTEGRGEDAWLRRIAEQAGVPDYEAFREAGIHWAAPPGPGGDPEGEEPYVAFREQVELGRPFATPSRKIEIFSERLAQRQHPLVPPIPRYLDLQGGPTGPFRGRYPLQLLSPKSRYRTNSTLNGLLGDDRAVTLHPADAAARGLQAGARVRVWNARGTCVVALRVSSDLMPGVAVLPCGLWVEWDDDGRDSGGCPNTLTDDAGTAWGCSSTQQMVHVEVGPDAG